MKKTRLISLLLLLVLLLAACSPEADVKSNEEPVTSQGQASPLDLSTELSVDNTLPENYDPSIEEGGGILLADGQFDEFGHAVHAGATPIPINPVDMPTPPPRPALVFNYATYTAAKLGITFESVAGYLVDDSAADTYILTEPIEQQKENYSVQFTFIRSNTNNNYTLNNVRSDVRAFVEDLSKNQYQEWRPSETSSRNLMGKPGYYITYRGVKYDGTIVRGRVHMALLDNNRLLTIHYTGPGEYNIDYTNVFYRIRDTLKAI